MQRRFWCSLSRLSSQGDGAGDAAILTNTTTVAYDLLTGIVGSLVLAVVFAVLMYLGSLRNIPKKTKAQLEELVDARVHLDTVSSENQSLIEEIERLKRENAALKASMEKRGGE